MTTHSWQEKKERLFKELLEISENKTLVCKSLQVCLDTLQEETRNQTGTESQQQAIALAWEGFNNISENVRIAEKDWMKARDACEAADTAERCHKTFMEAKENLAEMQEILTRRVILSDEKGNITQEEVDLARQVYTAETEWIEAQNYADTFNSDTKDKADENLQQLAAGFFEDQPVGTLTMLEVVPQSDVAQNLSGNKRLREEEEVLGRNVRGLVEEEPRSRGWIDPRNGTPNPPMRTDLRPADPFRYLEYMPVDIAAGIAVEQAADTAVDVANRLFDTTSRQITVVAHIAGIVFNRVARSIFAGLFGE